GGEILVGELDEAGAIAGLCAGLAGEPQQRRSRRGEGESCCRDLARHASPPRCGAKISAHVMWQVEIEIGRQLKSANAVRLASLPPSATRRRARMWRNWQTHRI